MTARARRVGRTAGYDPVLGLAAGVVHRAVDDLRQRGLTGVSPMARDLVSYQAARWLASDEAASFCGALGIDADAMGQALGLPGH